MASLAVLALALAVGFAWYERSRPSARVLALVASMAALAVVGRIAFAPIPNVKPTTDIVLLAGYALGGAPGFMVGAITALASNFFFTQGPWTPWQMAAWGGVGIAGAGLARLARGRDLGRWPLAAACGAAGLAFGAVLDAYQWTLAAEQTLPTYLAVAGTSLPYNLAHALGNVAFCLVIGPPLVRALRRYRRRFEFSWPAPQPAAVAALTAVAVLGMASQASAASPAERAASYLESAQNRDGGFGGARGQSSTPLYSGWSALGLAASGRDPATVRSGQRSLLAHIRAGSAALRDTGELERTILVLRSAGRSPRSFAGRDLVQELEGRRRPDGSVDGLVNTTAFGVLALRAAGRDTGSSADFLEERQNSDGGWGFAPGAQSDVDDTGAVLQALAAAGRRGSAATRRALAYLRRAQQPDGGFGSSPVRASNAQSTAFAVQGLVAAGRNPARFRREGRDPLRYLRSLQARDGSVRYSRTSSQTPVWVTAQALLALEKEAFPLTPVRRERAGGSSSAGPDSEAAASERKNRRGKRSERRRERNAGTEERGDTASGAPVTATAASAPAPVAPPARVRAPLARTARSEAVVGGGGAAALIGAAGLFVRRRRRSTLGRV